MTVQLAKDLEQFVHDAVRAGLYASEDDVIRDALLRLKQSMPEMTGPSHDSAGLTEAEMAGQELQRRLFEAGLVNEIKPPIRDLTPYQNRRAVLILGEPLSETVIRERR